DRRGVGRLPVNLAQQAPVIGSAVLPLREYLLTGLTAAVVTFLLTGPVRVLAVRLGAVAWPRGRDVHSTPTPRWGGLAMLGGVLAGCCSPTSSPHCGWPSTTRTRSSVPWSPSS